MPPFQLLAQVCASPFATLHSMLLFIVCQHSQWMHFQSERSICMIVFLVNVAFSSKMSTLYSSVFWCRRTYDVTVQFSTVYSMILCLSYSFGSAGEHLSPIVSKRSCTTSGTNACFQQVKHFKAMFANKPKSWKQRFKIHTHSKHSSELCGCQLWKQRRFVSLHISSAFWLNVSNNCFVIFAHSFSIFV